MPSPRSALVVGASRGLGLVLVQELAGRGWSVIATTRGPSAGLESAAAAAPQRLRVVTLDMTDRDGLAGLRAELDGTRLDLLFVNAAVNYSGGAVTEASQEEFVQVMVTNALSPVRVLDALRELVVPGGTVAVMSSEQGSIARNEEEGFEVYKASKAALNQLVRSYANRRADDRHTTLLIDPGHNRTGLGGEDAPLSPAESIPLVVDVIETAAGRGGVRFLDRHGDPVPW